MTCIGGNGTWQGGHGPTCCVGRCHLALPNGPTPCHATNPSEGLHTTSPPLTKLVWSKGPHWATLDPQAHCHTLGWPKPTSKPPHQLGNWLTCHATAIQDPSSTVGWQGDGMDGWSTPLDIARQPSHPKPPHLCLQVPLCPLQTIKGAMVLGGDHHSAALKHSKCSKLSRVVAS
jgi:hypothetical protein